MWTRHRIRHTKGGLPDRGVRTRAPPAGALFRERFTLRVTPAEDVGMGIRTAKPTLAVLMILVVTSPSMAAPGDFDVTFGVAGFVRTPIGTGASQAQDIAVQPDGRIVAVGHVGVTDPSRSMAVVRYHPDGALDDSFGESGVVLLRPEPYGNFLSGVAIQPDGKILLAGASNNDRFRGVVLRLNPNGSLDEGFGGAGMAALPFGAYWAEKVGLQSDGRIIVVGNDTSLTRLPIYRLNADGSLDTSFGSGGAPVGTRDLVVSEVAIYGDDSILGLGETHGVAYPRITVVKLSSNGVVDESFGTAGFVDPPVSPFTSSPANVLFQTDGKIVIGAISERVLENQPVADFTVVRLHADGTPDASFGNGGLVRTEIGQFSRPWDMEVQEDGRIVLGGYSGTSSSYSDGLTLARYEPDGSLDSTFGAGGLVVNEGVDQIITALDLQADGRLVAATISCLPGTCPFTVVRYETAPTSCGNGVIDGGEECDPSASIEPSCCAPTCYFRAAGAICRARTGVCDLPEACDGTSAACPADIFETANTPCVDDTDACTADLCDGVGACRHDLLPDHDDDGTCDASDPCTDLARTQGLAGLTGRIVLRGIGPGGTIGDDRLSISASFDLPIGTNFSDLNLAATGARLVVTDQPGGVVLDALIPAGFPASASSRGWVSSAGRGVWKYFDRSSAPVGGIERVVIADRSRAGRPRLRVSAVGRNGTYQVSPGAEPLGLTIVVGAAVEAEMGLCTEALFEATQCTFGRSETTLTCRR